MRWTRATRDGQPPRRGRRWLAVPARWRPLLLARAVPLAPALVLVAVVGVAAFAVGRASAPEAFALQPAHVALPAQARLVRREEYNVERVQNWYYVVPGATHDGLTSFYRARLAADGWSCFRAMTSRNITREGKSYTGSSVYITALRGAMRAQIYTADQEYGAFLLQNDLPTGALGLKISLEVAEHPACV